MIDAREEPVDRTRILNGVAVPGTEFAAEQDHYPDHEGTVVEALRRRVRRGDSVVVVGGGWGTSAVVAARMTHYEGDVTVYEPSSKMLDRLRRTVEVNGVADVVALEHAAIGPVTESSERIFGEVSGDSLPPDAVPSCDVLEVDCEGAELDALRALEFTPRLLTVEAHSHLGCSPDDVEAELVDRNYTIVEREPIREDSDIVHLVALQESP